MLTTQTGVTHWDMSRATEGVILFAPFGGDQVYLIHTDGRVAHQWTTGPGFTYWCYLLDTGNLFVNERMEARKGVALTGSGVLREYGWDGNLVWEHSDPYQHHDGRKMAHGRAIYAAYTENVGGGSGQGAWRAAKQGLTCLVRCCARWMPLER